MRWLDIEGADPVVSREARYPQRMELVPQEDSPVAPDAAAATVVAAAVVGLSAALAPEGASSNARAVSTPTARA